MVWWSVLKITRSEEAGYSAAVAESKLYELRWSEKILNQQNFQKQKEGIFEIKI